jgi:hypothetical protein
MRQLLLLCHLPGCLHLIQGILAQDGPGFTLYSDSDAMKYFALPSSITLELTEEQKRIACRAGALVNVTRLWPLPSRDERF